MKYNRSLKYSGLLTDYSKGPKETALSGQKETKSEQAHESFWNHPENILHNYSQCLQQFSVFLTKSGEPMYGILKGF